MMPSDPRLADHHRDHLRTVLTRYQGALEREGLGGVVIYAGEPQGHFLDDTNASWKPNPHFSLFAPLPDAAGSAVLIPESGAPELLHLQADDFWHAHDRRRAPGLRYFPRPWLRASVSATNTSPPGPPAARGRRSPSDRATRPYGPFATAWTLPGRETPYELACLRAANARAVRGHRAVAEGFRAEDSEFELHLRYLAATGHEDHELPYTNIIGLNERGAILHYHHRTRDRGPPSRSLLIDAGANAGGYAADVTRTYAREPGAFQNLIDAMDALQQGIVARLAPAYLGKPPGRHHGGPRGGALVESGIAQASKDALLERRRARALHAPRPGPPAGHSGPRRRGPASQRRGGALPTSAQAPGPAPYPHPNPGDGGDRGARSLLHPELFSRPCGRGESENS